MSYLLKIISKKTLAKDPFKPYYIDMNNNTANNSNNNLTLADVRDHAGWSGKVYYDTADGVIVGGTLFWTDGGELFATDRETAECTDVETKEQLESLI